MTIRSTLIKLSIAGATILLLLQGNLAHAHATHAKQGHFHSDSKPHSRHVHTRHVYPAPRRWVWTRHFRRHGHHYPYFRGHHHHRHHSHHHKHKRKHSHAPGRHHHKRGDRIIRKRLH